MLALQVHIPDMSIDLVQSCSGSSDDGSSEGPTGLFCMSLSDLQTTLAIDEDFRDLRCFSSTSNSGGFCRNLAW